MADADVRLMVPEPVAVKLVAVDVFQAKLALCATVHVPEPMATVRVLLLEELKPPLENVTL